MFQSFAQRSILSLSVPMRRLLRRKMLNGALSTKQAKKRARRIRHAGFPLESPGSLHVSPVPHVTGRTSKTPLKGAIECGHVVHAPALGDPADRTGTQRGRFEVLANRIQSQSCQMHFHASPVPEEAVQGRARDPHQFADTSNSQTRRPHLGPQDFVDSSQSQIVNNSNVSIQQNGLENAPKNAFKYQHIFVRRLGRGTGEGHQNVAKKGRPNAADYARHSVVREVGQRRSRHNDCYPVSGCMHFLVPVGQ
jgi:hypothetical protein